MAASFIQSNSWMQFSGVCSNSIRNESSKNVQRHPTVPLSVVEEEEVRLVRDKKGNLVVTGSLDPNSDEH